MKIIMESNSLYQVGYKDYTITFWHNNFNIGKMIINKDYDENSQYVIQVCNEIVKGYVVGQDYKKIVDDYIHKLDNNEFRGKEVICSE